MWNLLKQYILYNVMDNVISWYNIVYITGLKYELRANNILYWQF